VYFANENLPLPEKGQSFRHLTCGTGSWGQRLRRALEQIPEEYVLYTQEDMWLTGELRAEYLQQALRLLKKFRWHVIKLQTNCHHEFGLGTRAYNDARWYITSHQPALWRKSFLMSTLDDSQSPFRHETETNAWLQGQADVAGKCHCGLEFRLPAFPYVDVSRQGQLREVGRQMLIQEHLTFRPESDEIFYRGQD
jgi:hypothetical protein